MKKNFLYKILLGTSFMLFCSFVSSQIQNSNWAVVDKSEVVSVYEKAISWFVKTENCKVSIQYSSYTNHTSKTAYDISNGYYKKNKENINSSSLGIVSIQNAKICFIVDSANKMIVLKKKNDLSRPLFDSKAFSESLSKIKSIKKQIIDPSNTLYRLEFNANSMYEASEFIVNEKGLITIVKYYYSKEVTEEQNSGNSLSGKPRLEIKFTNYQSNAVFNYEKEFSEKKYFIEIGKKPVLNDNYKKFELIDYRFEE